MSAPAHPLDPDQRPPEQRLGVSPPPASPAMGAAQGRHPACWCGHLRRAHAVGPCAEPDCKCRQYAPCQPGTAPPIGGAAMGAGQEEAGARSALTVLHGPWEDPENPGWLWRVVDDGTSRPVLQSRNAAAGVEHWTTNGSGAASREIVRLKNELFPIAFADCEALVSAGLLALAEKEDEKAQAAHEAWCRFVTEALRLERDAHKARAACLSEMSLAVSLGQFRTDAYDSDAVAKAHARAALAPNAAKRGRAGGLKAAANMSAKQRTARASRAAKARHGRAKKGE